MGVPSSVNMVQRLTYRRRQSYATKSNKVRKVKTPGGLLTSHNVGKKAAKIKCGDCGLALQGIPALRPCMYKRLAKMAQSSYGQFPIPQERRFRGGVLLEE